MNRSVLKTLLHARIQDFNRVLAPVFFLALLSGLPLAGKSDELPFADGILSLTRPILPKPAQHEGYTNALGGITTRLSDSALADPHNEGYSLVKNEYARVPIENADGSKLLVYGVWKGNDNYITSYGLMDSSGGNVTLIEFGSNDNPGSV